MSSIQNVAVLGASGSLGQVIVPALLKAGFVVTIISRSNGASIDHGPKVALKKVDYGDVAALTAAFQGQHAVVEAFNPAAAANQRFIVEASIAAGVTHLITPDFSSDTFNPHADELLIFDPKRQAQKELESIISTSASSLSWTAIIVGAWYDWGIESGQFWIDRDTRTIRRIGSGDQRYSMSRLALSGDAVVAVLQDPGRYRNRPAYFASHTVSTNELIALTRDVPGPEWKVVDIPVSDLLERGRVLWAEDTKKGVTNRLTTQAYPMLGTAAIFDEKNRYGADFGEKLEPGWDEGLDALKANLKNLLN